MTGLVAAAVLIPAVLFGGEPASRAPAGGPASACAAMAALTGRDAPARAAAATAYGTVPAAAPGCLFVAWAPARAAPRGCRATTVFGGTAGAQGRCVPAAPK